MPRSGTIRTPDQRLRVFVSSTLVEMQAARIAVRQAIEQLRLTPVMFELGARPHPPRDLYRAYLDQSDVFIGLYWQSYGWVAPDEDISGLEDEFRLSAGMPRLLYVQEPAPDRHPRLETMLESLRSDGSVSYKHFTDPEELSALVLDDLAVLLSERFGLEQEHSEDTETRRNLVLHPANPLIGRETEVNTALEWLASDHIRLITLSGPGGVGKSRLAIELAELTSDAFPDGVWTVLLESIRDPSTVLPTIARALSVPAPSADDVLDAMCSHLAGRKLLLVLDNFEHVLEASTDIARLLDACPGIRLLVTSRVPLRLRAEHELPIGPLEVPVDPTGEPLERVRHTAAVQLFLARARAAHPDLPTDDDALRAVGEICRRLDGLPLAIELAAARVRLLPPQLLLQRLEDRFALLTAGTADAHERHQTLRATIDWGYELLEPAEQVALRRLSAFSGGWTLGSAEAVLPAGGELGGGVLDVLDGLVTKSFVVRPELSCPAPRFGMLETIQAYAREVLLASTDLEPTVDAHANHFLTVAENAAPELQGPDQVTWFEALELDHGNFIAALHRLEDRGDVERQLRLTAALGRLWMGHSHVHEARHWLLEGVRLSEGRRDALRAELLSWAGWLTLFIEGDHDRTERIHWQALEIRRELGDKHGEIVEVLSLGNVAAFRGDLDEARQWWEQVVDLAEDAGDDDMLARGLGNLGLAARLSGDLDTAAENLRRSSEIHSKLGDQHSVGIMMVNMCGVHLDRGDIDAAEALAHDAIRQTRDLNDAITMVEALEDLATVWCRRGEVLPAAWLFGAAEAFSESLSLTRSAAEVPIYEEHVDEARSAAEAAGLRTQFDAAWKRGAEATSGTAIAVALGEQPVPESVVVGEP